MEPMIPPASTDKKEFYCVKFKIPAVRDNKIFLEPFNHSSGYFPILLAMYCRMTYNDASA